jgi:hypothetical protein
VRAVTRFLRPKRVKTFVARLPASAEARLIGRMARLGIEPAAGGFEHLPHVLVRFVHHAPREVFVGKVGATRVLIRIRKGANARLRISFTPQVNFRRAWRLLSRLGVNPSEGSWT